MRPSAWVLLAVDIGIKVALVALLGLALLFPDLPQFAGKAMQGRVLTYGLAMLLVPAIWFLRFRRHPYPVVIDILITLPFLIDVAGNALDLYDTIEWWDDANHFVNWALLTGGVALALAFLSLGRLNRFGLAVGYAALTAIVWELAEYVTFIRDSPELATATPIRCSTRSWGRPAGRWQRRWWPGSYPLDRRRADNGFRTVVGARDGCWAVEGA